jgi:hypothetical protein
MMMDLLATRRKLIRRLAEERGASGDDGGKRSHGGRKRGNSSGCERGNSRSPGSSDSGGESSVGVDGESVVESRVGVAGVGVGAVPSPGSGQGAGIGGDDAALLLHGLIVGGGAQGDGHKGEENDGLIGF